MTHIAHEFWAQVLRHGDVAVDATCGNGHDTVELAQLVGSSGKVFAFDVQSTAIHATRAAVEAAIDEGQRPMLEMRLGCHSLMDQEVGSNVARLVCFNLG
jgi:tRNA A58 N-methylase Trm61